MYVSVYVHASVSRIKTLNDLTPSPLSLSLSLIDSLSRSLSLSLVLSLRLADMQQIKENLTAQVNRTLANQLSLEEESADVLVALGNLTSSLLELSQRRPKSTSGTNQSDLRPTQGYNQSDPSLAPAANQSEVSGYRGQG